MISLKTNEVLLSAFTSLLVNACVKMLSCIILSPYADGTLERFPVMEISCMCQYQVVTNEVIALSDDKYRDIRNITRGTG
jgi:hypothetical protein